MKIEIFESEKRRGRLSRYDTFEVLEVHDDQGNTISVYSSKRRFLREKVTEEKKTATS